MVTEGASDQVICEKVRALLDVPPDRLKVLAAGGIAEVRNKVSAVVSSLTPLVTHDSPYAQRVVALIDRPSPAEQRHRQKLQDDLGDRLYVLDANSLESYLPQDLYAKAQRDKVADRKELERLHLRGEFQEMRLLKREISDQIAHVMAESDLASVATIRDAVLRAARWDDE